MHTAYRWWIAILVAGFVVRLILAILAPHPGIADPNHYYNLARNLVAGRGFIIDYIWQYHNPPLTVTHPEDYWMPLAAIWPAIGLKLFGNSVLAALIPSVILGSLIPVLAFTLASAIRLMMPARLMAMSAVVFLPEFLLNSARTDTSISYILFAGTALLCFYLGIQERPRLLLVAGAFAGLAQLTRQDGVMLLPAMFLSLIVFWRFGMRPRRSIWLLAVPLMWLLVMSPWLLRNYSLFNEFLPSAASRTRFMTSFIDQFTYGRTLDLQHYLDWGWPNILSNIAFQSLANVKTTYILLDVGLPMLVLLGIGAFIARRDKEKLLFLTAPILFILLLFLFYSFITPFHSQGGSFKKSYLTLIPYLAVVGAWTLGEFVQPRRVAYSFAALMAVFMLLNGIELTRADFVLSARYNASMIALGNELRALGDRSGDGKITVIAQDPFMLNYHGFYALMMPSDDRDTILEAAHRYEVDYIILPAARPSLDLLYNQEEKDPRLPMVGRSGNFQILQVLSETK
jgi:4-amino-4-deoxy-L-arabinose transferase-like glycosyltransferase